MIESTLPKYLSLQKKVGETPLSVLQQFKLNNPEYKDVRLAYAGRLDPQASGELLVLVGEECKNRDHYQGLDKIYTFDIIVGLETDTGDIMGITTKSSSDSDVNIEDLDNALSKFTKKYSQKFPVFSSKAVDGKPLWKWAKENRLDEIEIPEHEVEVKEMSIQNMFTITSRQLMEDIKERINLVTGDFRQEEIIQNWENILQDFSGIHVISIKSTVASGTYIRQLAMDIGDELEVPMCCWHIHREKVIL